MKIKNIAFVGIPVTDMKRAREFYEGVLGLEVADEMMNGNWVEYAIGENTLAIASVADQWAPSDQGTAAALEVENFDETIKQLKDRQTVFNADPFETPVLSHGRCSGSRRKQTHNSQTQTRERERNLK